MTDLTRQRCHVHPSRQAAARCPVCSHSFCRECVTEHEGRVICSRCLVAMQKEDKPNRAFLSGSVGVIQLLSGFALLWLLVYHITPILLQVLSFILTDVPSEGLL